MHSSGEDIYRPAVLVIRRVDDKLVIRCGINAGDDPRLIIRFEDVFGPVVEQRAVAKHESQATRFQKPPVRR